MAYGYGIPGGYDGGSIGDGFQQTRFSRRDDYRPSPAPAGLVLCLVVSGVTWRFVEQNCYSTSLIARPEGIVNNESHEAFLMKQAGKLLADVKAWLEAR